MSEDRQLTILVLTDGENEPVGLAQIISAWRARWATDYPGLGSLQFTSARNLKRRAESDLLPQPVAAIAAIRNPDVFFVETSHGFVLGGVEITTHSPDGSNVEKRYPYLWASGHENVNAFIACPYQKARPTGATNRLPNRHARRNASFLERWNPTDPASTLRQIVPIRELQAGALPSLPAQVRNRLLTWNDLGSFFAHTLALKVQGPHSGTAQVQLRALRDKLLALAEACLGVTSYSEPSSLIKASDRWVQVYNCRPDIGHWERGEGQFDSIDGRLMFTLDEITALPAEKLRPRFEFWLPQMTSKHPWIVEQQERGYQSKRLRNILLVLKDYCTTRFADQLNTSDWDLLRANRGLLLERLDWRPAIYKVADMVPPADRRRVAAMGLRSVSTEVVGRIAEELGRDDLYFSAHRAYLPNWQSNLETWLRMVPGGATVLVPRVPSALLISIAPHRVRLVAAEECSKVHLLMLRQLHRFDHTSEPIIATELP